MKQKLQLTGWILAAFMVSTITYAQSIFINEIHYDNDGIDSGEAVEVAGPSGTDLSEYSIVLYNGSNNSTYGTYQLSGIIPDQQNGFGTSVLNFAVNGLQNGAPDGFALVKGEEVIQFLSYEGVMTAANGPAAGMTSVDVGVEEGASTPIGYSLQLAGEGQDYSQFTWQPEAQNTFGTLNNNQSFGGEPVEPEPAPEPEPELPPAPAVDVVFINEIHYDNAGADVNEGVEIAGTAGTDLTGYKILLYNGSPTQLKLYNPSTTLSGVIPNQQNGYGTLFFPINGIQNGDPDGFALVNTDGTLIQFLTYGGTFTPIDGPAAGIEGIDIGVKQSGTTPIGFSLQLTGMGSTYADFTWAPEALNTYGAVNTNQTFISPEPVLFINEFHYDTVGSDVGEGIEVAGTAGLDLSEYTLILYNGANGASYKTVPLEGTLPNLQNGYGALSFLITGIQNGAPDGFALVKGDEVLQFLSYEGVFTATNGPAAGMESVDVGVEENGVPVGYSLQLGGAGFNYEDFTWQVAMTNTFGAVNTNQTLGASIVEPEPEPEIINPENIAEVRASAVGTKVSISGTLTVASEFGNTAYIQDETGGIAIFGNLVTEQGLYKIGDSLKVTGTRAVFNDLVQISDVEAVEYLGVANEPIEPKSITLAQMEEHRGQLVKITDMVFPGPGQLFFGNSKNYLVKDASGEGELRINASVNDLVGKLQPEVCAEVIGVVGRFRLINQLQPRNGEDLPCAEDYDPTFPGSEISKEVTFDAVTWNIEWFGDEANSPAARKENSDEIQKETVKAILLELDADVIAVQEISDEILFAKMVSEMEGYDFILSDATSYPDSPGGQKVGFIYNAETVSVTNSRAMFTSVHPFYKGDGSLLQDYPESADRFYASGRLPFLMEANVTIDGYTEAMKFVALHARANGSTGAQGRYDMRKYDVEVLKDSLDLYYPTDKVMILGDYNDDVDFTVSNVNTTVSSYISYTSDTENYTVLTAILSEEGYRSYAVGNYDDMIDHIMVTNELTNNYIDRSARVHYEFYNSEYVYTASDHFPVSVRLKHKVFTLGTVTSKDATCNGSATGTASVEVSGGIAPYTYNWSDGQDTQTATTLSAGNYNVIVTDYLGTIVTTEVTVSEAENLVLLMEDQKVYSGFDSTCTKLQPVEISGGVAPYTYLWSTGETSDNISVCPGNTSVYTLEVKDANGCSITVETTVEVQDISCGNGAKADKVQVCFKGKTLCVAKPAVDSLLKNGAKLGSCSENDVVLNIEEIIASPNPTSGYSVVRVTSAFNGSAVLSIYNIGGNKVQEEKVTITEGTSDFQINLGRAIPGIYIIKIKGINFESESVKIIKF
jgi:exonuclease III